jgi:hypothetical protein
VSPNQYTRPGSDNVPVAVNNVVLITTPEGTTHASGCGCGSCTGGGGAVTGAQGTQGVRGPQGTTGLQGATGIAGAAVDNTDDVPEGTTNKYFTISRVSYEHMQGSASNSWTITHNLGFKPNVTVIDSAGNIVEGEIAYTNTNSLTVSFQSAFSGTAYIS